MSLYELIPGQRMAPRTDNTHIRLMFSKFDKEAQTTGIIRPEERTYPVREFGDSRMFPSGTPENIVALNIEDLKRTKWGAIELLKHLPDAIIIELPKVQIAPAIDTLRRVEGVFYRTRFASPLFEYWNEYAVMKVNQEKVKVEARLRRQSRRNWWTKLCWKLGGFTTKGESSELDY